MVLGKVLNAASELVVYSDRRLGRAAGATDAPGYMRCLDLSVRVLIDDVCTSLAGVIICSQCPNMNAYMVVIRNKHKTMCLSEFEFTYIRSLILGPVDFEKPAPLDEFRACSKTRIAKLLKTGSSWLLLGGGVPSV